MSLSATLPLAGHRRQGGAAPRAEGNLDRAAAAIVNDQSKAAIHFSDERVGTFPSIGVNGAPVSKVAREPVAAIRGGGHSSLSAFRALAATSAFLPKADTAVEEPPAEVPLLSSSGAAKRDSYIRGIPACYGR